MRQTRLLTLLALLMTAATGAWAQSATTTYQVNLKDGATNPDTWTAKAGDATTFTALPQYLTEGQTVTLKYSGTQKVKSITATIVEPWDGNLATVTEEVMAVDGTTISGTLGANVKITIAPGATVTFDNVSINADGNLRFNAGNHACITCLGDATIILKDGTTNIVEGYNNLYPGIHPAKGHKLIIGGSGSLTTSSWGNGAGIGGGFEIDCGSIEIKGGTITSYGGGYAAGIGAGCRADCGSITISGGTVTASGGPKAAGIGSGYDFSSCGNITIANTVDHVTAKKGMDATNSIGEGNYFSSCGTVSLPSDASKVTQE